MKMNRRNVLAGLGALGIGGGALLGSGAFTSVEAERDVEVNVVADDDISNLVDIWLWAGEYDTVDVLGEDDDVNDLFPDDGDDEQYVSLIANDVTIQFGDGADDLLPNTTTQYDDLFRIVKDEGDTVEVELELDGADWLEIAGESEKYTESDIDDDSDIDLDASVVTDDVDEGTTDEGVLTIRIEQAE